jgi:hypothetical protein
MSATLVTCAAGPVGKADLEWRRLEPAELAPTIGSRAEFRVLDRQHKHLVSGWLSCAAGPGALLVLVVVVVAAVSGGRLAEPSRPRAASTTSNKTSRQPVLLAIVCGAGNRNSIRLLLHACCASATTMMKISWLAQLDTAPSRRPSEQSAVFER